MAVQTKLFSLLGGTRLVLANRAPTFHLQPAASLKTASKEKLKSLPEKPKRPVTSFLLFSNEHRAEVKSKHPQASVAEVSKILGEQWKSVDPELKSKYEEQFKNNLKKYTLEQSEYEAKLTQEHKNILDSIAKEKKTDKQNRQMQKLYKETNRPKRPRTSYLIFVTEKTQGVKGGIKNILSTIKTEWEKLSTEQKQRYVEMAEDEKKRYELEMDAWESEMLKRGHLNLVRKSTLDSVTPKSPSSQKSQK